MLSSEYVLSQNVNASFIMIDLIKKYLYNDISSNLRSSYVGIGTSARKKSLDAFIHAVYESYGKQIAELDKLSVEMFILYEITNGFYRFNDFYFKMSYEEFRAHVLFPNLIYILFKYFHKARGFIKSRIRQIYSENSRRSYGLIKKHTNSFYLDEEHIKNDVLYSFLGNALTKQSPLAIRNLNAYYNTLFRNIFSYYFMREQKYHTSYYSISDMDRSVGQMANLPIRSSIYKDTLYKLQIEKFCESSPTLGQIGYNFNIFRNLIVNNEFQSIYLSLSGNSFASNNNEYKLLSIYNNDINEQELLKEIKKLPLIYKLLKSVHIVNPKVRPYNEMTIKPDMVRNAILEELLFPFRNLFTEAHIYEILTNIADNFVSNILTGEYVNILTLSHVKINHHSFIKQLRSFVNLCINFGDGYYGRKE